jgi:hypothetical protein
VGRELLGARLTRSEPDLPIGANQVAASADHSVGRPELAGGIPHHRRHRTSVEEAVGDVVTDVRVARENESDVDLTLGSVPGQRHDGCQSGDLLGVVGTAQQRVTPPPVEQLVQPER